MAEAKDMSVRKRIPKVKELGHEVDDLANEDADDNADRLSRIG